MNKVAVVAGAGPAGLTAARELLRRSPIVPIVFEADVQVGGISKTVNYRGNRMDLGGHRFFSKSDWVMRWWQEILPIAQDPMGADAALRISYQRQSREFAPSGPPSVATDAVMLIRRRLSRILHRRRLFDYPLKLNANTLREHGGRGNAARLLELRASAPLATAPGKLARGFSGESLRGAPLPHLLQGLHRESVGRALHGNQRRLGRAADQRIIGDQSARACAHRTLSLLGGYLSKARTETSLIERFLYPKLGPGQMWEAVAREVAARGGNIHLQHRVVGIERSGLDSHRRHGPR